MGLLDNVTRSDQESELAIKKMFPYADKFRMLQTLAETSNRNQMPVTVLGFFRRRYKSPVLTIMLEESRLNSIALDRKGRLELSEIVARPRLREEDKD